ncbi:uncharacterized protein C8Q71DRAFT_112766 [Rhodofomes roseus]|uniref:Uncharacterized protein n=1 Tax=Rhodofomes roseus TaxID=34475 RepID=A0ABQ8KCH9_9APHY|nr:uncharacterized protein C8Q71DRAFT_112766 [Rhodofomes roseus]KAH9835305.1 hypothetical protein C8Q71DRAFT_112766 [Rhodofomes roseus]
MHLNRLRGRTAGSLWQSICAGSSPQSEVTSSSASRSKYTSIASCLPNQVQRSSLRPRPSLTRQRVRVASEFHNLRDVMVQPYFSALTAVHVAMQIRYTERRRSKVHAHDDAEAIKSSILLLLAPWRKRGLVKLSLHMQIIRRVEQKRTTECEDV